MTKALSKSSISAHSFDHSVKRIAIKSRFNDQAVVIGFVDGKTIYHLETRNVIGQLLVSESGFNLRNLLKRAG